MTTTQFDMNREDTLGDIAISVGGAISGEVRVTIDDGISKLQAVNSLKRVIEKITKEDIL